MVWYATQNEMDSNFHNFLVNDIRLTCFFSFFFHFTFEKFFRYIYILHTLIAFNFDEMRFWRTFNFTLSSFSFALPVYLYYGNEARNMLGKKMREKKKAKKKVKLKCSIPMGIITLGTFSNGNAQSDFYCYQPDMKILEFEFNSQTVSFLWLFVFTRRTVVE